MAKNTPKPTEAPKAPPVGITAREFLSLDLAGFAMSDAHFATRIAYSTLGAIKSGETAARPDTLKKLEQWSRGAIEAHGKYISAARSLGLADASGEGAK